MIDRFLQPHLARILAPVARLAHNAGLSADAVTLAGFAVGMAAAPLIATEHHGLALACIAINRFLDGLDGALARLTTPTHRGAFIDISLDFFFYSSIPFAFAVSDPLRNGVPAAALMLAFTGTATSFLAFAVIAQQRKCVSAAFPTKGIYYLGGLAEGAETIAFFAVACLLPQFFAPIAWIFCVLCLVTTVMRWYFGWRAFAPGVE